MHTPASPPRHRKIAGKAKTNGSSITEKLPEPPKNTKCCAPIEEQNHQTQQRTNSNLPDLLFKHPKQQVVNQQKVSSSPHLDIRTGTKQKQQQLGAQPNSI
ncbi:hypothetical protein MTR_4g106515 [Medicago truncatula]|uniref:Uncharacterized protein n=1 Tax=Medicago truncatula TaxID=3880 RepID=A0A072V1B4_MEDTR|nr:hypothetical protein MTR_4g106515 [Medicago truncatula]